MFETYFDNKIDTAADIIRTISNNNPLYCERIKTVDSSVVHMLEQMCTMLVETMLATNTVHGRNTGLTATSSALCYLLGIADNTSLDYFHDEFYVACKNVEYRYRRHFATVTVNPVFNCKYFVVMPHCALSFVAMTEEITNSSYFGLDKNKTLDRVWRNAIEIWLKWTNKGTNKPKPTGKDIPQPPSSSARQQGPVPVHPGGRVVIPPKYERQPTIGNISTSDRFTSANRPDLVNYPGFMHVKLPHTPNEPRMVYAPNKPTKVFEPKPIKRKEPMVKDTTTPTEKPEQKPHMTPTNWFNAVLFPAPELVDMIFGRPQVEEQPAPDHRMDRYINTPVRAFGEVEARIMAYNNAFSNPQVDTKQCFALSYLKEWLADLVRDYIWLESISFGIEDGKRCIYFYVGMKGYQLKILNRFEVEVSLIKTTNNLHARKKRVNKVIGDLIIAAQNQAKMKKMPNMSKTLIDYSTVGGVPITHIDVLTSNRHKHEVYGQSSIVTTSSNRCSMYIEQQMTTIVVSDMLPVAFMKLVVELATCDVSDGVVFHTSRSLNGDAEVVCDFSIIYDLLVMDEYQLSMGDMNPLQQQAHHTELEVKYGVS